MSLYKNTYESVISTLATSIYNKIQSKIISTTKDVQRWGRTTTLSDYKRGKTDPIVTTEKISSEYTKPTTAKIESDIKTYIKNTLGFTDDTFKQVPDGNDMLSFIFALNYFLENSLMKVAVSLTTTTVIYAPITSGYTNNITLFNNIIDDTVINGMYNTLKNIGVNNNTGRKLELSGGITSSCCSSSCSSSSSSSSSSSCSSSSMFIVYFNI